MLVTVLPAVKSHFFLIANKKGANLLVGSESGRRELNPWPVAPKAAALPV